MILILLVANSENLSMAEVVAAIIQRVNDIDPNNMPLILVWFFK